MAARPEWLKLSDELLWQSIALVLSETQQFEHLDEQILPVPYMAGCHLAACLELSMDANEKGRHSAALCLVRQCLEALTLVEIGYQEGSFAEKWISAWSESKKSHGELRQALESHVWPRYGSGLWDEPWTEFFGNLARAVQPYSHYTPELQGWQWATITDPGGRGWLAAIGPDTYDALKASRITLLHALISWTLSRILLAAPMSQGLRANSAQIDQLGRALSMSKLLFKGEDWGAQLVPHMWFKPGHDWRDS